MTFDPAPARWFQKTSNLDFKRATWWGPQNGQINNKKLIVVLHRDHDKIRRAHYRLALELRLLEGPLNPLEKSKNYPANHNCYEKSFRRGLSI